jgi:hypothetical protein
VQEAIGRDDAAAAAAVLGVDPGRHVGLAWVDRAGGLLRVEVVDVVDLVALDLPLGVAVALGDGTGSREARARLAASGRRVHLVDERATSERGRRLYWRRHPPRGWRRLVPEGMRPPPPELDAYAAYAIALRFLADRGAELDPDPAAGAPPPVRDHGEGR